MRGIFLGEKHNEIATDTPGTPESSTIIYGKFQLDTRKSLFTVRYSKQWNRLAKKGWRIQFWEFSRSDGTKSWVAWSELSMDSPLRGTWDYVTSQGHNTHHEYTWSVFSSLFPVRKGWRVVNSRQVVILTSRRPATIPTTSCHLSRELIRICRTHKQF